MKYQMVTWEEVDNACETLATNISNTGIKFRGIFPIVRGGYIPGVILSHMLDLKIVEEPRVRPLLIVDDICDTGNTLSSFKNIADVYIATIHYHKDTITIPDFWVEEKKDKWIIYPWENKDTEGKYDKSFSV